ncbi:MerR family transcriptional regulator [bacterium]|nr:MAG: MerR family transcriptional regulator [bacterium]
MPDLLEPPTPDITIQEMAAQSGLSEYTLRFYERIGLIPAIPRDRSSGHRRYPPDLARRIENLACLRATGMSVDAIRQYLQLLEEGDAAAAQQKKLFAAQKAVLEREAVLLKKRLAYLDAKVAFWEAREKGDKQALACISDIMPDLIRELNESGSK